MAEIIKRSSVWLLLIIVAVICLEILGAEFRSGVTFSEISTIAIVLLMFGFNMLLSNIAVYSFTNHRFDNAENSNLGLIYLGTSILVMGVFGGIYFTRF